MNKDTRAEETDVLIVGAGPVGLSLANELSYRGVRYIQVDEGDGSIVFPAGENIFSRTMEHLRRWGIADGIRYGDIFPADYPRNIGFCTRLGGAVLAMFPGHANEEGPGSSPHSPEGGLFSPKKAFDDLGHGVAVSLERRDTSKMHTIHCRYLAACDGARSFIRRKLDIRLIGSFGEGANFAIHFRAPALGARIQAMFGTRIAQLHTVQGKERCYFTTVDGRDEWRFSMYVEKDVTPDPRDVLCQAIGDDIDFEIIRAQPWSGHRVVAERYRSGNIFLVGDAAHLRWPKGGFGANTGIGDAVDLGWKLAAVLQGWGGSALLDSYEAERRPIAIRNTNEAANNRAFDEMIVGDPLLEQQSAEGDEARLTMMRNLYAYRLREFRTEGIQLGYRYRSSPICVPDDDIEPPDDHMLYRPSTYPGARAPHARLADGRSTLDLFGSEYVLLRFDAQIDASAFRSAAQTLSIPLADHSVTDAKVAALYERPLVLVRPDGHVAWRGSAMPADAAVILETAAGRSQATITGDNE
jgi:2-polyprenyl-6-methoxyphenol hydroxylase-like FAD-dependent oxidoreductase